MAFFKVTPSLFNFVKSGSADQGKNHNPSKKDLLKQINHAFWDARAGGNDNLNFWNCIGRRRLDTAYAFAYTSVVLTDFQDSMNIKLLRYLP